MNIRKSVVGIGYSLVAVAALSFGIRYLLASQVMSYHLVAMGNSSWEGMSLGMQTMTLNFMKSAAAGFVTCAIAIFFLIVFPFRKDESWSRWALLLVSISELSIVTYCTYQVKTLTPANPPLTASLILIGICIFGFFLFPSKPAMNEQ